MNIMLGPSHVNKSRELQDLIDRFAQDVHLIFKYSAQMFIAPPKLLKLIKSKSWTQFVEVVNRTLELGNQITNYCLDKTDLHGGFLEKMQAAKMGREYINRIFVDLIIAAGDTTAFSTLWALFLLGQNKDTQAQLHNILSTDGNKESPLMKGIIKETLRMFPVAPFIGRLMPEDSVIGHYKINKNVSGVVMCCPFDTFTLFPIYRRWCCCRSSHLAAMRRISKSPTPSVRCAGIELRHSPQRLLSRRRLFPLPWALDHV